MSRPAPDRGGPAPPRRILHVIASLEPAGAEKMLVRLSRELAARPGIEQAIVSLRPFDPARHERPDPRVPVIDLGLAGLGSVPGVLRRLHATFRRWKPDAVQTWMYNSDAIGGVAARLAGVRRVYWGVRTTQVLGMLPWHSVAIAGLCAALSWVVPRRIVCCAEAARRAHVRLGFRRGKLMVIPNGYDFAGFETSPARRAAARAEFGVGEDAVCIGLVARWDPQKGHADLLAAMAQVFAAHPGAVLVLIGKGIDAGNSDLAALVAATGHPDRVRLMGFRRDVPALLAGLDIFCLSSTNEGFPNALAEAMAAGLPCVSTDVGGAAEVLLGCGPLVPPGDPARLAAALEDLVAMDPEARTALGARSAAAVREAYAIAAVADRYAALYGEDGT